MELFRLTNWAIAMSWRALILLIGAIGRVFLSVSSWIARRASSWRGPNAGS
jgi:hypothetical protein